MIFSSASNTSTISGRFSGLVATHILPILRNPKKISSPPDILLSFNSQQFPLYCVMKSLRSCPFASILWGFSPVANSNKTIPKLYTSIFVDAASELPKLLGQYGKHFFMLLAGTNGFPSQLFAKLNPPMRGVSYWSRKIVLDFILQ